MQLMTASSVDISPAPTKVAVAELSACLTLVAPSGMTGNDRSEWLKVAHMTLRDMPADLLSRGCEKARQTCRFPSEIVPAILHELEYAWPNRQERIRAANRPRLCSPPPAPQTPAIEYVDPAEVRKLLKSIR